MSQIWHVNQFQLKKKTPSHSLIQQSSTIYTTYMTGSRRLGGLLNNQLSQRTTVHICSVNHTISCELKKPFFLKAKPLPFHLLSLSLSLQSPWLTCNAAEIFSDNSSKRRPPPIPATQSIHCWWVRDSDSGSWRSFSRRSVEVFLTFQYLVLPFLFRCVWMYPKSQSVWICPNAASLPFLVFV